MPIQAVTEAIRDLMNATLHEATNAAPGTDHEVDGFAFHTDPETFERDRRKQNALVLAGYQVLRFTWLDLTEYPERVLALVQRAISAR